jgi:hypothetical protein
VNNTYPQDENPELLEAACEASGHGYFRDGADPVHGVCGFCLCGSRLYSITGELIEP